MLRYKQRAQERGHCAPDSVVKSVNVVAVVVVAMVVVLLVMVAGLLMQCQLRWRA